MTRWIKSSRCESGNCVQVARRGDRIVLRSSVAQDVELEFTAYQWADFLREVTGEYVPRLVARAADGGATVYPPIRRRGDRPVLFTRAEWVAFELGARDGEFAVGLVPA